MGLSVIPNRHIARTRVDPMITNGRRLVRNEYFRKMAFSRISSAITNINLELSNTIISTKKSASNARDAARVRLEWRVAAPWSGAGLASGGGLSSGASRNSRPKTTYTEKKTAFWAIGLVRE